MNTYDEAHALAKAIRECDEMKKTYAGCGKN